MGEPLWPDRVQGLLTAFAWEAANRERDVADLTEALAGMLGARGG